MTGLRGNIDRSNEEREILDRNLSLQFAVFREETEIAAVVAVNHTGDFTAGSVDPEGSAGKRNVNALNNFPIERRTKPSGKIFLLRQGDCALFAIFLQEKKCFLSETRIQRKHKCATSNSPGPLAFQLPEKVK